MKRFEKEGRGLPAPKTGFLGFAYVFGNNIWKLIGANLLFTLFSLGIITIPAAFSALNRVLVLLIRRGSCFLWQDFVEEFRRSFRRSLLPGLLFLLMLAAGYYFGSLGLTNVAVPMSSLLFWMLSLLLFASGLAWGAYSFVFIALLELNNRDALKDARLVCMARPGIALLIAGVLGFSAMIAAALMPFWLLVLPVFGVVLPQYIVCWLVNDLADTYILIPYERMKRENKTDSDATEDARSVSERA